MNAGTLLLVLSYSAFTFVYLVAPLDITRVSTFFPLLAVALFLKGKRLGFAWLSLIITTIIIAPEIPGVHVGYSAFDAIRISIYLFGLFLTVLYYERSRERGLQGEVDAAAVRKSEERIRALYSHQYGFMLVTSAAGVVQSASESVSRELGFAPTELVGTNALDLVHPDDFAAVAAVFSALTRPGSDSVNMDMRVRLGNGQYSDIEGNGTNLLGDRLIRGIVLNGHNISKRKHLEDDLRHLAQVDAVTGLRSRRYFFELAERETSRSQRYGRSLAVLMIDIDHFKTVNDTYGHFAGDAVLQKVGEVATKVSRASDIIGRIGGEEFALVLPETKRSQALAAAERLRVALAETAVQVPGAQDLHVTVSIGVTSLMPTDATFEAILARADAALFAAKESGRNRICTSEDIVRNSRILDAV